MPGRVLNSEFTPCASFLAVCRHSSCVSWLSVLSTAIRVLGGVTRGAEGPDQSAGFVFAFVFCSGFLVSLFFLGGYGGKEIREPQYDPHVVGDRI